MQMENWIRRDLISEKKKYDANIKRMEKLVASGQRQQEEQKV